MLLAPHLLLQEMARRKYSGRSAHTHTHTHTQRTECVQLPHFFHPVGLSFSFLLSACFFFCFRVKKIRSPLLSVWRRSWRWWSAAIQFSRRCVRQQECGPWAHLQFKQRRPPCGQERRNLFSLSLSLSLFFFQDSSRRAHPASDVEQTRVKKSSEGGGSPDLLAKEFVGRADFDHETSGVVEAKVLLEIGRTGVGREGDVGSDGRRRNRRRWRSRLGRRPTRASV